MKQTLDDELLSLLNGIVGRIARQQPTTPGAVRSAAQLADLARHSVKRRGKMWLRLAKHFRSRNLLGRLRAVTLACVADQGDSFLATLEQSGVLLSDDLPPKRFSDFINAFEEELNNVPAPEWDLLRLRVQTYSAYHRLTVSASDKKRKALRILAKRPRLVIKTLLALVSLAFLRRDPRFDLPAEVLERLDRLGTAEQVSSIVSIIVALANGYGVLDALDLGLPITGDVLDDDLWALLGVGRLLFDQYEIAKEISLFRYVLKAQSNANGDVFCVMPPRPEFEYFLRLGFIRAEQQAGGWPAISEVDHVPEMSLAVLAELFIKNWGDRVCQLRDAGTPIRRVRLAFPIIPELFIKVTDSELFDDVSERETLAQEFMLPLRRVSKDSETPFLLTKNLTVNDYRKLWRVMRFVALVDIAAIRAYHQKDYTVFLNSLVRISKDDEMLELFAAMGITSLQAKEFIELVGATVHKLGHYDLQYRPLLRIAPGAIYGIDYASPAETVHVPALVASTNIFRNVQVANKLRFPEMGEAFVHVLADMFKKHFTFVATNRKVKSDAGSTDVDIVVVHSDKLYLFECKHSVFPTEPHETRDVWEDIQKGVRQLEVARSTLKDPTRLKAYFNGWFPGMRRKDNKDLQISCCILCSHRVFSGMEIDGIPVRDYASFSKLASGGVVGMSTEEEGDEIVIERFQLGDGAGLSTVDLDDYLSPDSKYFQMFSPFMRPMSRLVMSHGVTIARESYVFECELDEWRTHLETITTKRLPDERRRLKVPASLQALLSRD